MKKDVFQIIPAKDIDPRVIAKLTGGVVSGRAGSEKVVLSQGAELGLGHGTRLDFEIPKGRPDWIAGGPGSMSMPVHAAVLFDAGRHGSSVTFVTGARRKGEIELAKVAVAKGHGRLLFMVADFAKPYATVSTIDRRTAAVIDATHHVLR